MKLIKQENILFLEFEIAFAAFIGAPVEIASAYLGLVFSNSNEIAKKVLKTMRKKKQYDCFNSKK